MSHYEITILIGPCAKDEAVDVLNEVSEHVYGLVENQGAAISMTKLNHDPAEDTT